MNTTNIKIGRKTYALTFDYKALKFITESFGFESFGDVQQQMIDLKFDEIKTDLTFKQYEYFSRVLCSAIQSIPENKAAKLTPVVCEEFLFNNVDQLEIIMTLYSGAVYKRLGKQRQVQPPQK